MIAEAILPVLTPFQFGPLSLANRAVVAPMTRVSATPDGVPTSRMVDYYREWVISDSSTGDSNLESRLR